MLRFKNHFGRPITLAAMLTLLLCSNGCNRNAKPTAGDATGNDDQTASVPTDGKSSDKVQVAFVTNQIASFWQIAEVGCRDAGKDFDINVEVRMPAEATAVEQKRIVEDLLTSGIAGIAISPIDAENQVGMINSWCERIPVITQDSDAPETDRLLYIGMDNYIAGRMCGELVKKALPDGGNIMLTIGRLGQDNALRRRQGVIDVLLGREQRAAEYDPTGDVLEGNGYKILDTLTDGGLNDVAKRKAEDALTTYPDLDAFVGLFAYNPPACLQAIKSQNKLGKVKLIGFDESDETLRGIKDGHVVGTIVQDPYNYGYASVRVLNALIRGDQSVIPESKFIDIPARAITKENVDAFWDDLKAKTGG